MSLTHYGTLGVDRTATTEEIKAAYRALAGEHHPDRGGDHAVMAGITVAYDWLYNRRKEYDHFLDIVGDRCTKCKGEGRTYKQKGFSARLAVSCKTCNGEGVTAVKGSINIMQLPRDPGKRRKK